MAPRRRTTHLRHREHTSWSIAARLLEYDRHLKVVELHPHGGQADVLAVLFDDSYGESVIDLRRDGAIKTKAHAYWWPHWDEDLDNVADVLAGWAGLELHGHPPRPAPTLARLIAALLRQNLKRGCAPGVFDSSYETGRNDEAFECFPGAAARLATPSLKGAFANDAAYRFFFVGPRVDRETVDPELAIELTGHVWRRGERDPIVSPTMWRADVGHLAQRLKISVAIPD